jgi:hypothetical protein
MWYDCVWIDRGGLHLHWTRKVIVMNDDFTAVPVFLESGFEL